MRPSVLLAAVLGAAVSCGLASAASAQAGGLVVYEGATLIVGDGRPAIPNAVLIVDNGRIGFAGARLPLMVVSPDAKRVNLAGKTADFLVLDANPLDDIRNTRKISAVYLRGAAVDRTQP